MLEIGSILDGKYKILSEIGRGGMSVVYMALNEKANKTWAVKVIRKDGKLDFSVVRQGLVAEIETLKKLNHPNLPSIVDVIEDSDTFIIVMDYIEGNSLDKALNEHGAQPQEYVVEWAMQLADVLCYLHSCSPPIIYRDMKPANVMLKPDGNIALIDFGTAKTYDINYGETTGIGTVGYAAPEQYLNSGFGRTDARTDIYCLGMTLYHLLTGIDPCRNVISDRSIRAVNPSLSAGLDEIIQKCTETNPDDRYQSAEELMYDLNHFNEMGEVYRRKQGKRLKAFIASTVVTVLFGCVSVFGYLSAERINRANYDSYLEKAKSTDYSTAEKCDYLIQAIEISPEKSDAYLQMVELFRTEEKDETEPVLTRKEAQNFVQLRAGYFRKGVLGTQNTVFPLDELERKSQDDFVKVCVEIGYAYWCNYEVESERYTLGSDWFSKAADRDSIAKTFSEIGRCWSEIKKYKEQNRTQSMYKAYGDLWERLNALYEESQKSEDVDIKIQTLNEIVKCLSTNIARFSSTVPKEKIVYLLDNIDSEAAALFKTTQFDDVKETLNKMRDLVVEAKERAQSVIDNGMGGDGSDS